MYIVYELHIHRGRVSVFPPETGSRCHEGTGDYTLGREPLVQYEGNSTARNIQDALNYLENYRGVRIVGIIDSSNTVATMVITVPDEGAGDRIVTTPGTDKTEPRGRAYSR